MKVVLSMLLVHLFMLGYAREWFWLERGAEGALIDLHGSYDGATAAILRGY